MPTTVDHHEVQRLVAEGAQLVEVLPQKEYDEEHISGAISIPLKEFQEENLAGLKRDIPVVVYCADYQ